MNSITPTASHQLPDNAEISCALRKSNVCDRTRTASDQDTLAASKEHWAKLIDAFEKRRPKLAELMRRAEDDVLAYKAFSKDHWPKIHSTNLLERLTKEIKRRRDLSERSRH